MSLGIVIKGTEGIVLAAESRVTLSAQQPQGHQVNVNYDNATKLISFSEPNTAVGVVTYGLAAIGFRTAHSFVPEFEAGLPGDRLSVQEFALHLSNFFVQQWNATMQPGYQGPNMTFVIGGFDKGEPYGRIFVIDVPANPTPVEHHPGHGTFGITWGGQRECVDRLIQGFDPALPGIAQNTLGLQPDQIQQLTQALNGLRMAIPLAAMALQDCVDLAIFFIRTTIGAQSLTVGIRGCGGPIDVATITRRGGLQFVQQKRVTGEAGGSAIAL